MTSILPIYIKCIYSIDKKNITHRRQYYYYGTTVWNVVPAASVMGIQTKYSSVRLHTMVEEVDREDGEIPPVVLRNRSHAMNGNIASPGEFVFY